MSMTSFLSGSPPQIGSHSVILFQNQPPTKSLFAETCHQLMVEKELQRALIGASAQVWAGRTLPVRLFAPSRSDPILPSSLTFRPHTVHPRESRSRRALHLLCRAPPSQDAAAGFVDVAGPGSTDTAIILSSLSHGCWDCSTATAVCWLLPSTTVT